MDYETARKEIGLLDSMLTRRLWNAALTEAAKIAEDMTYRQGRDRDLCECEIEAEVEDRMVPVESPPYLAPDYVESGR